MTSDGRHRHRPSTSGDDRARDRRGQSPLGARSRRRRLRRGASFRLADGSPSVTRSDSPRSTVAVDPRSWGQGAARAEQAPAQRGSAPPSRAPVWRSSRCGSCSPHRRARAHRGGPTGQRGRPLARARAALREPVAEGGSSRRQPSYVPAMGVRPGGDDPHRAGRAAPAGGCADRQPASPQPHGPRGHGLVRAPTGGSRRCIAGRHP